MGLGIESNKCEQRSSKNYAIKVSLVHRDYTKNLNVHIVCESFDNDAKANRVSILLNYTNDKAFKLSTIS